MQEYNKADKQLHRLAQVIAKFNRTYVPKKDDDSHTNLAYEDLGKRLTGRWVKHESGKVILAYDLSDQKFKFYDQNNKILKVIDIESRTIAEIERTIEAELPYIGLDPKGFKEKLHFDIPEYDEADSKFKKLKDKEIEKWTEKRNEVNILCKLMLDFLQLESEIRIWPHHFDTGIYIEPNEKSGIGFGFAMTDDMVGEPYYYLSAYGLNGYDINYDEFKGLSIGQWEIHDNWKGAVLRYRYSSLKNSRYFLKSVLEIYMNA